MTKMPIEYGLQKISARLATRLITRSDDGYVAVTAPRDEPINHKRHYFLECASLAILSSRV